MKASLMVNIPPAALPFAASYLRTWLLEQGAVDVSEPRRRGNIRVVSSVFDDLSSVSCVISNTSIIVGPTSHPASRSFADNTLFHDWTA